MLKNNRYVKEVDGRTLRKVCVRLSLSTFTSIEYFETLRPDDLRNVIDDIGEANKQK